MRHLKRNRLAGKLFTLKAVAALLDVPQTSLYNWIRRYSREAKLGPPIYRQGSRLPRHRGLRPRRYLRPEDIERLVGVVVRRRIWLELHPRGTRGQFLVRQFRHQPTKRPPER